MTDRRVYVVDDEEPIRRSSSLILRTMRYEPRPFASGREFLDEAAALPPGCVLLDVRMPEVDGLAVLQELNARDAGFPIIVMSGHADVAAAVTALQNGAVGFLEKPFSRKVLERLLAIAFMRIEDEEAWRGYLGGARRSVDGLGPREREVLDRLAGGLTAEAIAQQLAIDAASVEVARSRIFEELGADSIAGVLRTAFAAAQARRAEL